VAHEEETWLQPAEQWSRTLALWREIDEDTYALCRLAFGDHNEQPPDWPVLAGELCRLGLARPVASTSARLVFEEAQREALLEALDVEQGIAQARSALIQAWLRASQGYETATIAAWAREGELWTELSLIWVMASHRHGYSGLLDIIPAFAGLPEHARRDHPVLSLAAAIARGRAAPKWFTHPWAGREIVRDGILFHSRWRSHSSNDEAITAGALWMLVQRQLPSAASAAALSTASVTKAAVSARVEEAAASADPPGEYALQLFHVAAAETSLHLDDLALAAAESDIATMLGDGPLRVMATGLRAVAQELMGQVSTEPEPASRTVGASEPAVTRTPPIRYAQLLASGMRRLAELDHAGVAHVLARVPDSPEIGAPYAMLRAWIDATQGALWGDPEVSLAALDWVQNGPGVTGIGGPLTRRLLTGARIQLLTQLGAHRHVEAAISTLPPPQRWVHTSRALLWSGEAEHASSAATAGIYDVATPRQDRQHLLAVKAAALLVDHNTEPAARAAAVHATASYSIRSANYLPLALLPTSMGLHLLEQLEAHPEWERHRRVAERAKRRFALLSRREGSGWPDVRLTSREQVLLPLLATTATIPEIADRLSVSVHTVRKQVATLRSKFGAPTRAELVRRATQAERTRPEAGERRPRL